MVRIPFYLKKRIELNPCPFLIGLNYTIKHSIVLLAKIINSDWLKKVLSIRFLKHKISDILKRAKSLFIKLIRLKASLASIK